MLKNTSDAGGGTAAVGRSRSGSSAHQRRVSVSKLALRNGNPADSLNSTSQSQPNGTSTTSSSLTSSLEAATSTADIRAALSSLHTREDGLSKSLQGLVAGQADLSRDLLRLDSLRATLGAQVIATRGIATTMLAGAADTAGRLSSTVRNLDLEKEHVEATLRVVEQVAELKACVAGVVGSMGAPQDWEAAAAYLSRASRIPQNIVKSGFANAVVPTVEVPDPPAVTLEDARESLCGLFLREFEKAAKESDDARVTRFFKLFPLIGRTDVGLDVYGRYVCQGVAESARNLFRSDAPQAAAGRHDTVFYPNALAKLFTHISQIVEGHGALVERHYGGGQMIKVISRLQKEADVQGGIIIDTWSDERGVDRKLTDVKSYPFSFLVQSFGPRTGGGGSNSVGGSGIDGSSRVNSPALGADGDAGKSPRLSEDEGGVNMREIDGLLNEIAIMLSRWSLYSRFLATKCRDEEAEAAAQAGADKEGKDEKDRTVAAAVAASPEERPLVIPNVLTQSNLQRKVSQRLITPYSVMTTFFFRRSVEKAFQLEEMPGDLSLNMSHALDNNPPYIISAVDDVMYIVNGVIQKCMSTLQRDVVVGVVPPLGRVLGSDFISMIQRKMIHEAYPKPLVQGGLPPDDRVIAFIVLINSLDMAMEYLARIVSTRMGVPIEEETSSSATTRDGQRAQRIPSATAPAVVAHLRDTFSPFDHDVSLVATALSNLFTNFTTKAVELQNEGITVLFGNYTKPRIHSIMTDTFRDVDYSMDEQEVAEVADMNDEDLDVVLEHVIRRFEHGWDALMRPLARIMTPRTFAYMADLAARYAARSLERRVWTFAPSDKPERERSDRERDRRRNTSAYGAIRLERDINGIVGAVARGSSNYGARELFAKTTQILMVANMEDDEWEELGGAAASTNDRIDGLEGGDGDDDDEEGMVWLLSEDERRRARGMVRRVV